MIERNINETILNKEPSAKALVEILLNIDKKKDIGPSAIYHHFPLYPNSENDKLITANLLLCSQNYGIIIFKCVDFSERVDIDRENIINELDEIDRLIFAKILKDAPKLRKGRRDLKINIKSIVFLNNYTQTEKRDIEFEDFVVVKSEIEVETYLKYDRNPLSEENYNDLKATIEGSKGIPRPVERNTNPDSENGSSKGKTLTLIDNEICNFDLEQKRAALFTLDGAQRIRGLAGSGKTIILAMKAAMIHLQNDQAEILYTYYTKTLYDIVKRLITRFYRQFADKDPDWRKIHIMHAWGGKGLEGVYYNACNANYITPINFTEARSRTKKDPFDYICEELDKQKLENFYDYTLLDEAQDFPSSFYRVCRQLTKRNRVVWAYDDFQNILHVKLQSEKDTFGKDEEGKWHIDFEEKEDELQDLVLHKCYRNPRKILVAAFALGLGIYNMDENNKVQIIQRLESNDHWNSLGFDVREGNSEIGDRMVIERPSKNSPLLKNELLDTTDEIIKIYDFENFNQECKKISELIFHDIKDGLNPEDISVICLDNVNVKNYFNELENHLVALGIKPFNLLNAPNDTTVFKVKDHVTLSTIFRAKGNEAGSVYIMGTDIVFSGTNRSDLTERNKLFTAITRAQGWVTITGTGKDNMAQCIMEFNTLQKNNFELIFTQPSEEEVKTIWQDISKKQSALNRMERAAEDIAKEMGISKEEVINNIIKSNQPKKK
ncbi:DEAD/DEAH box helicase [Pedobacter sp. R-06]|uniref:DEAD/DEAH box helicase n=1 Tax=Pedobacter sp. R-06 TaxID=3404051 RepID=UPI003CF26D5A